MRLILEFRSLEFVEYSKIDKYTIQGFIYYLLRGTSFSNYHNIKGFKFFNFSNVFPLSNFEIGNIKKIIISSPNVKFIKAVAASLKSKKRFHLNKYSMEVVSIRTFKPNNSKKYISSTPIVLFEDNRLNKYFSLKQNNNFEFFFNRLKDNSLKKYNAYYNDEFIMDDDIFDIFELNREVSIRIKKNNALFIVIGTIWKILEKRNNDYMKFYNFVLDTGLGEKNSLGFGMVNTI